MHEYHFYTFPSTTIDPSIWELLEFIITLWYISGIRVCGCIYIIPEQNANDSHPRLLSCLYRTVYM